MSLKFDLVFEGGGAKGIVFVGALQALEEKKYEYRRLIGTSAGAISAVLCAAGYNSNELLEAVNQRTPNGKPIFTTFMDRPKASDFSQEIRDNSVSMQAFAKVPLVSFFRGKLLDFLLDNPLFARQFSFIECGGFYSGNTFLNWIGERLKQKEFDPGITLLEFYNKTQKDLSLVATNVTKQRLMVLNHRTAPNLPVARAVRMSMSIPFVWQEVTWDSVWGNYLPIKEPVIGSKIVDGGVLSNFPMNLIAETNHAGDVMGENLTVNFVNAAENLGLLIDESKPVSGQPATVHNTKLIDDLPTIGRIHKIAETMMSARDNSIIDKYRQQICFLPAQGYGTLEFDMDETRRDALITAGKKATFEHLAVRGF